MAQSPAKKGSPTRRRRKAATHAVEKADVSATKAVAPIRKSWPVRLLGGASELADQPPLITLTAAVAAIGLVTGERPLARAGFRMLGAELLATWIKTRIKHRVDRTRPYLLVERDHYSMEQGDSHESQKSSFPSGHTAGAVAVARALAREYPGARGAANGLAAAVAAVQIPRCAHFVSDIAAGAAIGVAAEAAVDAVVRAVDRFAPAR